MNRSIFAILALLGSLVTAQAATLLPNGKQTFINANGAPLALGTVTMYVPGTTTAKTTWQDSAQTIQNTNPIILGPDGSALIYGSGCYRQIVKDASGNTIWDQPTCDTSSTNLIWAGHSGGTANNQTLTASNFSSVDGQTIAFIASQTNTSALTLTVNSGSPINVLRDTASGPFSLAGGEVFAGNNVLVQYDATRGAFHLVSNPVTGANPLTTMSGSGTTDLGTASSHYVYITGTATISSFGSSVSASFPIYQLLFASTSTLVNSANLLLPGGANITTAFSDSAIVAYNGAGAWRVLSYSRANGTSLAAPALFQQAGVCPWPVPVNSGGALPLRIEVEAVGGGGGGGGNGNDGGAGGTTTFAGINANGGGGGIHATTNFGVDGGSGGIGGTGSTDLRIAGQHGGGSGSNENGTGVGAAGAVAGAGGRAAASFSVPGAFSPNNTTARQNGGFGAGGAGFTSGAPTVGSSSGGGGGEYVRFTINNPGSSIACSFGAGGTAGTSAGGGGGGTVMTRSFWQ